MKPNAYLLLVDDDPVLLRSTARALGAAGYFVEVAFSAAECLRLARLRRPDLILLDVVLPDESGVEVCRGLKAAPETSSVCVILISGFQTSSGHQESGLAAGADAYIVRPISTPELVTRIGALLRVQQARSALRETHISLERVAAESTPDSSAIPPTPAHESIDRRSSDSRLPQPAGIETAGELAAKLAKLLDNLLTVISCNTSLVLEDPRLAPELRPHLDNVSLAAHRGADLALGLLHFSGQQMCQPRVIDLNENIEHLGPRLRTTLGSSVNLEFQLAPGLPQIVADPGMLEQILLILAANARDAMPQGGRFVIQTQSVETHSPDTLQDQRTSPTPHLCLSVADSGCGMDTTTQQHIFVPFFTTKPAGKGFGLGLATVQDVVQQHQGHIEVQSEVGHGSTFRIFLPVTRADL